MATAKKPIIKPPAAVYLFCPNVQCNAHVTVEVGAPPLSSGFVEGADCPFCLADKRANPGKIQKILLEPSATAKRGIRTAVALPGKPYGGLLLQRGDDDGSAQWGGQTVSDPRHDGAQYVAELQVDLVRLGYYGPARGGETLGVFGLQLMACVLNIKQHLAKFYGIPTTDVSDPSKPTAIAFPANGLVSPAEIFSGIKAWSKLLGTAISDIPLLRSITKFADEWEKLQRTNAPTLDQLQGLRDQAKADTTLNQGVQADTKKADSASSQFGTRHGGLNRASLDEARVAAAELALDNLIVAIAKGGQAIPSLLNRTQTTDARLPGQSKSPLPSGPFTLTVAPAADGSLEARFDRLKQAAKDELPARDQQRRATSFIQGKLGTFKFRLDQLGKRWLAFDKLEQLLAPSLDGIRLEVKTSASEAVTLNVTPPPPKSTVLPELTSARNQLKPWCGDPSASAPGPTSIQKVQAEIARFDAQWAGQIASPQSWQRIKNDLLVLASELSALQAELLSENAPGWRANYKQSLQTFGQVDEATARHIRTMVVSQELGGTKIFLTPMGDEIIPLQGDLKSNLPLILDNALTGPRINRPPGDGPLQILEFIYRHESGGNQSRKFAGRTFATLGIDWPNPKTGNASFDEDLTPGQKLSTSRGWGATQLTLFEGDVALSAVSGGNETFTMHAGIPFTKTPTTRPLPLAIASAVENITAGTTLFLSNFAGPKRECSFKDKQTGASSGRSYACHDCARKLQTGPSQPKPGGIRSFDDSQGDFEQIKPGGAFKGLFRLRSLDRLRELLGDSFALDDARGPDDVRESDLDEFPCSWLGSIIRYSGVSRRGFDYMLEGIDTLKKG